LPTSRKRFIREFDPSIDYLVILEGGKLRAASDVEETRFFPLAELERLEMTEGTAAVIRKAWNRIGRLD
jgi:hypothetical protein